MEPLKRANSSDDGDTKWYWSGGVNCLNWSGVVYGPMGVLQDG